MILIIMRPEMMQNIAQLAVFIGVILTAFGGYGHFYYGKKIDSNKEIEINQKLENIPNEVNDHSDKNTDKVLDAIEDVKLSVEEMAAIDGSNLHEITYPEIGEFGLNILDKKISKYDHGTFSMKALVPKNQEIIVEISGEKWSFPLFQSLPGWKYYDRKRNGKEISRKFKTVKCGSVDFEIYLNGADKVTITVYENNSSNVAWQKNIIIEEEKTGGNRVGSR